MTFPYRSHSPILKVTNKRKAAELLLEKSKIHRVRLIVDAFCDVVNVASPSCVWFKLRNSISKDLQYVKPSPLRKFTPSTYPEDDLFKYVMAPIEADVYARGRIINVKLFGKAENRFALVHFIDDGYAEWMNIECLAHMGDKLYTHPWQAFPIALFKSMPGVDLKTLCENPQWTEHATRVLANILEKYEYFRIHPIPSSERQGNNYYEYVRADVFGLLSDGDLTGESIAHRFSMEIFAIQGKINQVDIIHRTWFDAKDHYIIRSSMDEKQLTDNDIIAMPNWRREYPVDFCPPELAVSLADLTINRGQGDAADCAPTAAESGGNDSEEEQRASANAPLLQPYAEWDPDCPPDAYPKIRSVTLAYLRSNQLCIDRDELFVCVQWESLKSPNEFYAYAMSRDAKDPLHASYLARLKWSASLDAFYGHHTNRRTIDAQVVMRMLREEFNPRVFAIYEYNDERTTGSYRRVEILAVRDVHALDYSEEFCRIRFLDVGGSNIVPLASLLAIHSQHCIKSPMSMQLSLGGIVPPDGALTWTEKSCCAFRKLARTDMAMTCRFIRQVPDNIRTAYSDPPQTWPGVFEVDRLRLDDADRSVEEEMLEKKYAVLRQ